MPGFGKKIVFNALAWLLAAVVIFPVLWLILSSFKPGSELFSFPLSFFPRNFTFDSYIGAWSRLDFMTYTKNTMFVAVTATVITVVICSMCGYALAKYPYKWVKIIFFCMLATTMLPTEIIMSPSFEVIRQLGLYNNIWGVIIPTVGSMTGIFLTRQFFVSVPNALMEAARIDGGNEWFIFWRIMFPIARPTIAILTVFSFRWRWNDYIWPLIVLDDPKKYTLQIALRNLAGAMTIDWTTLLAASVISMIPVLLVYLAFQKQIINAETSSGVK